MNKEPNICKTINIDDAKELIKNGNVTITDIRDKESFLQSHVPGAILLNQDNIDEFKNETGTEETVIIYCYHGINSKDATKYFDSLGYENVYSLDGGFSEYSKQDH